MKTVLYLGRLPRDGSAGGYHAAAEATLGSSLARRWRFVTADQTAPGDAGPVRRFGDDLAALVSTVRRERPDVAHMLLSYRSRWPLEVAQFAALRAHGVPVAVDVRAGAFQAWWSEAPLGLRAAYGVLFRRAAGVTAEMEADLPFLSRTFGRIARYSPSFVTDADLAGGVADLRVRRKQVIRLAWAGRFSVDKGAEAVLDALERTDSGRFHLTVTGSVAEPALWRRLQAMAEAPPPGVTVDVRGFLPSPADVLAMLRTQHVFLLPSAYAGEGHSNAVNQAMCAGLPVIASAAGPLRSILPPQGAWFVRPCDGGALVEVLREIADRPGALGAMGTANRARVAERYNEHVALGAFEAAWRDAVEGR